MSSAVAIPESPRVEYRESTGLRKLDRFVLLYEGILAVIGRVHTGRQRVQDPDDFRSRMKQALREIESTATRRGYTAENIQNGHFAVVTFLDEAVMTAPDTSAVDWARKSLAEELFGERTAGEVFFKRIEELRGRRDSQDLAEVLEVYYLCLLLGFEGKYAGHGRGELQHLISNLRERLERMVARDPQLSPDAALPEESVRVQPAAAPVRREMPLFALAALLLALLCYVGFSLQLRSQISDIQREVSLRVDGGQAQ